MSLILNVPTHVDLDNDESVNRIVMQLREAARRRSNETKMSTKKENFSDEVHERIPSLTRSRSYQADLRRKTLSFDEGEQKYTSSRYSPLSEGGMSSKCETTRKSTYNICSRRTYNQTKHRPSSTMRTEYELPRSRSNLEHTNTIFTREQHSHMRDTLHRHSSNFSSYSDYSISSAQRNTLKEPEMTKVAKNPTLFMDRKFSVNSRVSSQLDENRNDIKSRRLEFIAKGWTVLSYKCVHCDNPMMAPTPLRNSSNKGLCVNRQCPYHMRFDQNNHKAIDNVTLDHDLGEGNFFDDAVSDLSEDMTYQQGSETEVNYESLSRKEKQRANLKENEIVSNTKTRSQEHFYLDEVASSNEGNLVSTRIILEERLKREYKRQQTEVKDNRPIVRLPSDSLRVQNDLHYNKLQEKLKELEISEAKIASALASRNLSKYMISLPTHTISTKNT